VSTDNSYALRHAVASNHSSSQLDIPKLQLELFT
jgi:hypothetical protein